MNIGKAISLFNYFSNHFKSDNICVDERTKTITIIKPNKNILFILRLRKKRFGKNIKFINKEKEKPLPF